MSQLWLYPAGFIDIPVPEYRARLEQILLTIEEKFQSLDKKVVSEEAMNICLIRDEYSKDLEKAKLMSDSGVVRLQIREALALKFDLEEFQPVYERR